MKLHVEWGQPVVLNASSGTSMIYEVDLERIPAEAGLYVFGRRWGSKFEALYVGKATNLRTRVKGQLNNLRLMRHVQDAKTGTRVLLAGRLVTKRGQKLEKCVALSERALIRYFLSEAHDLVNKQGTLLRRHELVSVGIHSRFVRRVTYLERAPGE